MNRFSLVKQNHFTLFLCFLSEGGIVQALIILEGVRSSEGCLVVAKYLSSQPGDQWKGFPKLSVSF